MKEKLLALGAKKLALLGAAAAIAISGIATVAAAETGALSGISGSPSPTSSAATSPTASPSALPDANAGGKNVVLVINRTDNRFAVDGRVQFNRVPGPSAGPANLAIAYSQCTNCQTLALALQINLISTHASNVQPQNTATATNVLCNGCVTVAVADQWDISVDDPTNVPPQVDQLIAQMKAALAQIKSSSTSITDAESRFSVVLAQFTNLAASLRQSRQEETAPTTPGATPLPSASPSASPTSSSTPTAQSSIQPTPTSSP